MIKRKNEDPGKGTGPMFENMQQLVNLEEEPMLLIDCFSATVGTIGGDGHDEIVLYLTKEGEYQIHFFSRSFGEDETHRAVLVDKAVVAEAYRQIEQCNFFDWYKRSDCAGITGAIYGVKFRDDKGEYHRFSSERMPMDGQDKFRGVAGVLRRYAEKGTAIQL